MGQTGAGSKKPFMGAEEGLTPPKTLFWPG